MIQKALNHSIEAFIWRYFDVPTCILPVSQKVYNKQSAESIARNGYREYVQFAGNDLEKMKRMFEYPLNGEGEPPSKRRKVDMNLPRASKYIHTNVYDNDEIL